MGWTMKRDPIPVVILAGSDRQPPEMPAAGRDKHPLSGYKGVDVLIDGRPLVETLVDRLRDAGGFAPIYVAGPRSVYGHIGAPARLIEANDTFGKNIRTSLEYVRAGHPRSPIAFLACDVVPEVETLRTLLEHFHRHSPCHFWFPLIRAPEDRERLGASSWKPAYRIAPEPGEPAVRVLPGHLVVVDPDALRRLFVYRLMQLGYRTRNRSITYRRGVMVRGVVFELLFQDLRHLLAFRPPTLTWTVLSAGISAARELKAGTVTRAKLEDALCRVLITHRYRKRYPERRVLLPIVEGLSLALDIDTEEEAREMGGDLSSRSA